MLYFTQSTDYIAEKCSALPQGKVSVHTLPDGELNVVVHDVIENKEVIVCASTRTHDSIVELLLLLDVLQRKGARINLILLYFGYARQDKLVPDRALGAQVICRMLQPYQLQSLSIFHPHSQRLHEFISYDEIIPYSFFETCMEQVDCIIAPDKGAIKLAQQLAERTNKPWGYLNKRRISGENIIVEELIGDVSGKKVLLVDDMISTGRTLIGAAEYLRKHGATDVYAAATHGLFTDDAAQRLEISCISRVFVTNSLPQKYSFAQLIIRDIGPLLCDYIQKR